MNRKFFVLLFFLLLLLIFNRGILAMEILSTAFANNGTIPARYTCDGQNISPDLYWRNVPPQAKSLVLICDDPDAPSETWVHWIVYNIPPTVLAFEEDIQKLPLGAKDGLNSWPKIGYGGPCPPNGKHRYFFKLYALDTILDLKGEVTSKILQKAMTNHILATATLMGTYRRPGR